MAQVNINSLKKENKSPLSYFKDILQRRFLDILCISESKLDESITSSETDCEPDFKCYRKDRSSLSGGLCVWIRSDIPQQRQTYLEFDSKDNHIESFVIELTIKKEKWYLILAYKNPAVSDDFFISKLKEIYEVVFTRSKEIILMGDLNIDTLNADNILQHDLSDMYGLTDLVKKPTCFKKPEGTLIDHILVRNPKRFKNNLNVFCGYSDWHNLVGCVTKLEVPPKKPLKITYRSYKNFNEENFRHEVSCIPFHICSIFTDVNDQYWAQTQLLTEVLDEHAPIKHRYLKEDHVPYMNSELRRAMYRRNMIKNKYRKDRTNRQLWLEYVTHRNKVVQLRRQSIKNYFMGSCNEGANGKDFWNAVKPFIRSNTKSRRHIMLNENDNIVTDTTEICDIFINFFSNVANNIGPSEPIDMSEDNFLQNIIEKYSLHESIVAIRRNCKVTSEFRFHKVSVEYINKILVKVKSNKATGFDNIPPKIIKLCADEMAVPMTDMINTAIESNIFPNDMKFADLCPVFKKKDDMIKNNYRPVSVLPVASKVFEIVISDQLMEFFNCIFNALLCAYRKKYGCQHVLVKVIDSWKKALDNNEFAGAMLFDLSKAFDCMIHGLLIAKLKAYGVSDDACTFISSYLSNRYQRVRISDKRSNWQPLTKGVPQGSCLGPLLFNIFMNDLFYFIERCKLINYADDNFLSGHATTIEVLMECLKIDGQNALHWFRINFMEANPSKLQFMLLKSITSNVPLPDFIEVENEQIERSSNVNLLGITVDDKLKFDIHINSLCRKAVCQINVLYRFSGIFNLQERERIYNTFILSNFNYCPIVWHFCGKTSTRKLEKTQERALRFLHNDKVSPYDVLLAKSGSTTLHIRRIKAIACEVFKSLNDLNPTFMKEMFIQKETPYNLRDSHILFQPKFNKIRYGMNTFEYYGAHIWNVLPNHIKESTTISTFKVLIGKWDGPQCQCNMCDVLS